MIYGKATQGKNISPMHKQATIVKNTFTDLPSKNAPPSLVQPPRMDLRVHSGEMSVPTFPSVYYPQPYCYLGRNYSYNPGTIYNSGFPIPQTYINQPIYSPFGLFQIFERQNHEHIFKNYKLEIKTQSTQTPPFLLGKMCSCQDELPIEILKDQPKSRFELNTRDKDSQGFEPYLIKHKLEVDSDHLSEADSPLDQDKFRTIENSRPRKLANLCDMIQRLFIENDVNEDNFKLLTRFEKQLFYYLVKRKFIPKYLKGFELDDVTCDYQKIKKMVSTDFPRRPEECYKFILTRVLKYLRKRIETEYETGNADAKLYEIFFKEISEEYDIPMSDFYYPLAGNTKGKFHFNFVYFSKIFKSTKFLNEIEKYCETEVFQDYKRDLSKKVNALVCKWERLLIEENQYLEYAQQSILKYVIFNKRCKLPWTRLDVVHAIDRVEKLIKICALQKPDGRN